MTRPVIRVGTRGSALATTQATQVGEAVAAAADADVELVRIRTEGDVNTGPLATIGGTGVFVTAVRDALLDSRIDLAVHSFKDLPTATVDGLLLGAVPPRAASADALCARDGRTLAELPAGARVGTGSPRRMAQLLLLRADIEPVAIRGNIDTRLGRVAPDDLDAVVLAAAGLHRLGRQHAITEELDQRTFPPAPAQGALAVECRDDAPEWLAAALAAVDDLRSRWAAIAERGVLAGLQAGCSAPVSALGTFPDTGWADDGAGGRRRTVDGPVPITLTARVTAVDGRRSVPAEVVTPISDDDDALAAGLVLAQRLLDDGAAALVGGTP